MSFALRRRILSCCSIAIEALKSGMSFTEVTYYLNQLYFMHQGTYPFVCCTRKLPDELTNCNLSCSFHSIQAINGSVIAIVPSWIKGKCFRLPESLLVFSNKKLEFYDSYSEVEHSLYVGSYGRCTAVDTSDIDIMVILPREEYDHFDSYRGNGQSRLLQSVRTAIKQSYSTSDVRADGQVVKIAFSDEMKFEILPAFASVDWAGNTVYDYPDANQGGNWLSSNPKAEQEAMRQKNKLSNGLLVDTCRHMRVVRDSCFKSYHLSGIVIDSFVYSAIKDWHWCNPGVPSSSPKGSYEETILRYWEDFIQFSPNSLTAPGSRDSVNVQKSNECLGKVLRYMAGK